MLNVQKLDEVLVVSLETDNKLNAAISQKFKIEMAKLIDSPSMKIVIDLAGVDYIDSSGFGSLLSVLRAAKSNSAQLKLCNIAPDVMELVRLLQLQTVFDIRNNIEDSIKSFST